MNTDPEMLLPLVIVGDVSSKMPSGGGNPAMEVSESCCWDQWLPLGPRDAEFISSEKFVGCR